MRGNNYISAFNNNGVYHFHVDGKLEYMKIASTSDVAKKLDYYYKLFKSLSKANKAERFIKLKGEYNRLLGMRQNPLDSYLELPRYRGSKTLTDYEKRMLNSSNKNGLPASTLYTTIEGLIELNLKHIED